MKQDNERTVNIGTENKEELQNQALRFMKKYPKNKTAKQYARLLCWNIRVAQRTALENYIEPMIEHGILISSESNCYRFNPEYDYEESYSPRKQAEKIAKILEEKEKESETPFMDAVKQEKIKPRTDVPDS